MKKLAIVMTLIFVAGLGWRQLRSDAPDPKLLFDRFWVDHEPRNKDEKFQVLLVHSEHPLGHFATRTLWTGQWEAFHYHIAPREEGVMDFLFGNTNERQRVRYSARRCNESGFDFCLEITGSSRGVRRYFSKKQWRTRSDELDGSIFGGDDK